MGAWRERPFQRQGTAINYALRWASPCIAPQFIDLFSLLGLDHSSGKQKVRLFAGFEPLGLIFVAPSSE